MKISLYAANRRQILQDMHQMLIIIITIYLDFYNDSTLITQIQQELRDR